MKDEKKMSFFKRMFKAVTKFDTYQFFCEEKFKKSVGYFIKLVLLFSAITAIGRMVKVSEYTKKYVNLIKDNPMNFKVENDLLVLDDEGDNTYVYELNEISTIAIISDGEVDEKEYEEYIKNNYNFALIILKEGVILKTGNNGMVGKTYAELYGMLEKNDTDSTNFTKEEIINLIEGSNKIAFYTAIYVCLVIFTFIGHLLYVFIMDVLILSLLGFFTAKILKLDIKYPNMLRMAIYSLTLPIILCTIYILLNVLLGISVKYFQIMYNSVAYIYIITAIMMIKSDVVKQQMEVLKIKKEEEIVKEEMKSKKNENEKDDVKKEDKDN